MGQARQRGSFEERKKLAEFYIDEKNRYQRWLKAHKPKETRRERKARVTFNCLRAIACGNGIYF